MSYRITILKLSALAAFAILFIVACGGTGNVATNTKPASPAATTPPPTAVAQITSKHPIQLYAESCAACHKETGKGGKITVDGKTINPDDLTSEKMAAKTDAQLVKYITDGIPDEGMPAFKDKLSEKDILNLVIHIRWLQGKTS